MKDHALHLQLDVTQVSSFLDAAFPAEARPALGEIISLTVNHLRMGLDPDVSMTRPGGIVSGPTLMALVDVAAYAVIAAHHGAESMAVTNTLSISFLRACRVERIFADARILKLGRTLATIDVRVWQGEEERLVAQSTITYSLPE